MSWRQAVVFACVMGLIAAAAVWALERDQIGRLHGEVLDYLEKHDRFKAWESEQGGAT